MPSNKCSVAASFPYPEAHTPPGSPRLTSDQCISRGELKDLFKAVLEERSASSYEGPACRPEGLKKDGDEDKDKESKRVRASKLEYRTVNESWDAKAYDYKIVDSPPTQDVGELDEYVFIVRRRIDRKTAEIITFVDVKSAALRDILRTVLKDVRTAGLEEEKPAVEHKLLYHFMPELKEHRSSALQQDECLKHLDLLIQHLEEAYKSTRERLDALLRHRKISYDLLPFLFKPNGHVYMTCPATGLPRCVKYICGEEKKTVQDVPCFEIQGRCFDFDGDVFGEATETLQIESFRGTRRIENLPAYPLEYHPDATIKERFVTNGNKFISMMSSGYFQYHGNMFVQNMKQLVKVRVDGRIMVDAGLFRTMNPSHPRLQAKKTHVFDMNTGMFQCESVARIRSNGIDPSEMKEDDLVICSPTVLGFSLNQKLWGEFAVLEVANIEFSVSPFDVLNVPTEKKRVIMSVTESRVNQTESANVDDVIVGKGQGVIILLHGPPGVGKTLTAEAIAERLKRPLYSISAGELSTEAEHLEAELMRIFRIASEWKAVLLLDEADVYLQRRDGLQLQRNRLVATFLRTLEYYDGIFFLTTNMLGGFDEAILDRIQLKLRYDDLNPSSRADIFRHFLQARNASVEEEELRIFAGIKLNGREIKNIVKVAHNVAASEGVKLSATHVRLALTVNGHSIPAQSSLGFDNSLYD